MTINSEIVKNSNNVNNNIMKSNGDFTELLFRLLKKYQKKTTFKVDQDIYGGKFDKRSYPFVHQSMSFLLLKLLNNMNLQCPFWKNNIHFVKSIQEYKTSYRRLSDVYTIKGEQIPLGFDMACIVSTIPNTPPKSNMKYTLYHHTMMKKMCEHFNVIILKTKIPNICFTFDTTICKSGLRMKTNQLKNKRLSGQIIQWKELAKKDKLSYGLCYTIAEIPSLTLHKYLRHKTFENNEWKSILFQLFCTMHLLGKEIPGFVHHNLSVKHVYLKKVPKGGQFVYVIGGTKYYVPNYGYIVKLIPSSYSFANKLYENSVVFDEELQSSMGIHPNNTSFYDLHYFCNTLNYTKNVPQFVKSLIETWLPRNTISEKNTAFVVNKRLRYREENVSKVDFHSILMSSTFSQFKKVNKQTIVFHPQYKI